MVKNSNWRSFVICNLCVGISLLGRIQIIAENTDFSSVILTDEMAELGGPEG